jgi:hypothetical protein
MPPKIKHPVKVSLSGGGPSLVHPCPKVLGFPKSIDGLVALVEPGIKVAVFGNPSSFNLFRLCVTTC